MLYLLPFTQWTEVHFCADKLYQLTLSDKNELVANETTEHCYCTAMMIVAVAFKEQQLYHRTDNIYSTWYLNINNRIKSLNVFVLLR